MSKYVRFGSACAVLSLMTAAGTTLAQEHKDAQPPVKQTQPTGVGRGDRAREENLARLDQPGEMQRWLSKLEGKWDVTIESTGLALGATSPSDTGTSDSVPVTTSTGDRVNTPNGGATGTGLGSPKPDDKAAPDQPRRAGEPAAPASADGRSEKHVGHGVMKTVLMFGGRHAHSWVRADCDGKTYEGMGVMAYNNAARRFESTWTDNMHTGVGFMTGQLDADRKTLTFTGDGVDPENGSTVRCREVLRWVADDRYVSEFFQTGSDGTENRKMTITFVRTGKPDQPGDWDNPWMKPGNHDKDQSDRSRSNR